MAFTDWMRANTSNIMGASSSLLGFYGSYENSKIAKAQGKLQEVMGELEADALRRKATLTENMGVHGAEAEKYKGRVAHSDATAAMAASGGVVDPEMLAKIKQRADYNALSAVYDARVTAIGLREQASMASIGGKFGRQQQDARAADMKLTGITTALTAWPTSWNQQPKPPTTKTPGTYRPADNKSLGGKGYIGGF